MPELDITTDLRAGADNIHSIGPVQAANLLRAAAETIDKLRRELDTRRSIPEARKLLGIAGDHTIHIVGEERGCPPGSCAASPRCRNRAEMRANHGTPEQFIAAISRAAGEMTVAEADRAVARYCDAWEAATEPAVCTACEGEQFEGTICDTCGDHVELAPNGDGTFTRVYHSPEQIRGFVRADAEIIGAPSLAIAEQFDAEARLAAEEPGTPGDGLADIDSVELTIPPMPVQLAEHRRRRET